MGSLFFVLDLSTAHRASRLSFRRSAISGVPTPGADFDRSRYLESTGISPASLFLSLDSAKSRDEENHSPASLQSSPGPAPSWQDSGSATLQSARFGVTGMGILLDRGKLPGCHRISDWFVGGISLLRVGPLPAASGQEQPGPAETTAPLALLSPFCGSRSLFWCYLAVVGCGFWDLGITTEAPGECHHRGTEKKTTTKTQKKLAQGETP